MKKVHKIEKVCKKVAKQKNGNKKFRKMAKK